MPRCSMRQCLDLFGKGPPIHETLFSILSRAMESPGVLTNRLRHSSHYNHGVFQHLRTPGPAGIHDVPQRHVCQCQPELANRIASRINPFVPLRRQPCSSLPGAVGKTKTFSSKQSQLQRSDMFIETRNHTTIPKPQRGGMNDHAAPESSRMLEAYKQAAPLGLLVRRILAVCPTLRSGASSRRPNRKRRAMGVFSAAKVRIVHLQDGGPFGAARFGEPQ